MSKGEDEFINTKLNFETIYMLSKGITQFAFRSGPIDEMHSKNKFTQKDMESLNKFMTNRIASLLQTVFNGDITKALKVLSFYASLSTDWDSIKPDTKNFYFKPCF